MPETCREEKQINILSIIEHLVGFIYEIIQGCTVNKNKIEPSMLFMPQNVAQWLNKIITVKILTLKALDRDIVHFIVPKDYFCRFKARSSF